MIEIREFDHQDIVQAYDRRSWIYSKTVTNLEFKNHVRALDLASIQPGEKALEVAVGPGRTLLEIAKQVGRDTTVHGIDASEKMVEIARQKLRAAGFSKLDLRVGDARRLEYPEGTFDVLYNGYMLDLIPLGEMAIVMKEYKRVLKSGGRVVLLNMSKRDDQRLSLYERLYQTLPASFVLNFMGACRPVLMEGPAKEAGFTQLKRELIAGLIPSEIVIGFKP